ncbi:hypothetical protein J2T56_002071 [Natronobacillus azotifigens]|uniref:DUF4269 domain-containing protein n=1 Tax=Natronobacillus azotifigens TaxID=472978 RepID=A0A9J6RDN2_9BACI|nr:DUF4269 domain-containing protein [Natronobacillus azotifigens]MCZ0703850.1 DUF4269 domain-containing protein [Natronobacillus azotifigens]
MFETIDYLQNGNKVQKKAYEAINNLGIIEDLSAYNPILCGTVPIGIDIPGSDLDIIMEVFDPTPFEKQIKSLYQDTENFTYKNTIIRDNPVSKANFYYDGFEFELFGQPHLVTKQYAYLHMIIENFIITQQPTIKEKVISLKVQGYKTEPAFCKVLGLEGDSYESLIEFGKRNRII